MIGGIMLNGWIDIQKELPSFDWPILIWTESGCTAGYYNVSGWFDILGDYLTDVAAWQPMPFGPGGEALLREFNIEGSV